MRTLAFSDLPYRASWLSQLNTLAYELNSLKIHAGELKKIIGIRSVFGFDLFYDYGRILQSVPLPLVSLQRHGFVYAPNVVMSSRVMPTQQLRRRLSLPAFFRLIWARQVQSQPFLQMSITSITIYTIISIIIEHNFICGCI